MTRYVSQTRRARLWMLLVVVLVATNFLLALTFGRRPIVIGGISAVVGAGLIFATMLVERHANRPPSSGLDERTAMFDVVDRAARQVGSLDAEVVLGGALTGVAELGGGPAEVWLLDADTLSLQMKRRIGAEDGAPGRGVVVGLFEDVRRSPGTRMVDDDRGALIICPLSCDGQVIGMLAVRLSQTQRSDALMVQCIELLATQISTGLDVARNVAERRALEERLAHWAFHDSLTDLPNRVLFADRLELALARSVRHGSNIAILFLDLDGFKGINDTLGHAAGDQLLRNVSERLQSCLRPNDTLARYGGDEFVVLLEQVVDSQFAVMVAQRILTALERPLVIAENELRIQTSIGIALTPARPGADADVLRRADIAMYQAKAAGGSRFVVSPSPDLEIEGMPKPASPLSNEDVG
jgi:diguanylate cyclase (GGDEF)-like protein